MVHEHFNCIAYLCPMEWVYHISEIEKIASELLTAFGHKRVWALDAPMGAGKTTLISAICKNLGVKDQVSSPTFAIMNEYHGTHHVIYHMDWYRLKDEAEAQRAGVEMALEEADFCIIEWPEKASLLLPSDTQYIKIDVMDGHYRKIYIP